MARVSKRVSKVGAVKSRAPKEVVEKTPKVSPFESGTYYLIHHMDMYGGRDEYRVLDSYNFKSADEARRYWQDASIWVDDINKYVREKKISADNKLMIVKAVAIAEVHAFEWELD